MIVDAPFFALLSSFFPALAMKSCLSSGSRRTTQRSPLTGFKKAFAAEQFAAKLDLFLLNMKMFLSRAAQGKTASSEKAAKEPKPKMGRRKKEHSFSIFAIMDPQLLRNEGTEQVREILRASAELHTYAVSDLRVQEFFF